MAQENKLKCRHIHKASAAIPNGDGIYVKCTFCMDCLKQLVKVVKSRSHAPHMKGWLVMVPGYRTESFQNNFAAVIFANYAGRVGPEKVMVKV